MASSSPAKPVRIALFTVMGTFSIMTAVETIDSRDDLELAVVVTCTGPRSRRCDAHIDVIQQLWETSHPNVDVIVSNKKSKYADLMALYNVDLICCIGFPWLLPGDLLSDNRIKYGAINLHNANLPKYRGPNAFGRAIYNGDDKINFCIHRMDSNFDTGPILVKDFVPLAVNEDFEDLMKNATGKCSDMIDKAITLAMEETPGKPQVGEPSEAPFFEEKDRWIDFSSSALTCHNTVRAFIGHRDLPKGALANINGETLCLTKTFFHSQPEVEISDANAAPGTILHRRGDTFFVQCGDTSLEVLDWYKINDSRTEQSDNTAEEEKPTANLSSKLSLPSPQIKHVAAITA